MTNLKKLFNKIINNAQIPVYLCFYIAVPIVVFFAVPCCASSQGTNVFCEVFINGNSQIQQKIITCVTKITEEHKGVLVLIYPDKKNSSHCCSNRRFSFYRLTHYPAIVINSKTIIYPKSGNHWEKSFNANINRIINSWHWQFKIDLNSKPFNKDATAVTLGFCDPDLSNGFSGNIVILGLCHTDNYCEGRNVYTEVTQLAEKTISFTENKHFKTCPVPEQFILPDNNLAQSNCIIVGLVYNGMGELVAFRQVSNNFRKY